jgi:hypothetical protein
MPQLPNALAYSPLIEAVQLHPHACVKSGLLLSADCVSFRPQSEYFSAIVLNRFWQPQCRDAHWTWLRAPDLRAIAVENPGFSDLYWGVRSDQDRVHHEPGSAQVEPPVVSGSLWPDASNQDSSRI